MFRRIVQISFVCCLSVTAAWAQNVQQVSVAVKIIEFQTTKGVETGLSAYFKQRNEPRPYGRVSSGNGNVTAGDLTFPSSTSAGITVFLDMISTSYGDFEVVLQALVDQNRAYILSRPKAMVPVGQETPTVIETIQEIPYEDTVVVGATAAQVTNFRPTGVNLSVKATQVIDDDGDPKTTDDIFIQLSLTATVNEEGSRITVALDDSLAAATGTGSNAISVPEFISRSITTTVWVRHDQVLILGGLYRNTKNKDLTSLPWLTQGEDILNGAIQRFTPLAVPELPISTGFGNQDTDESRRELVFLIRSELWKPVRTVYDEFGFDEEEDEEESKERISPTDAISGVLKGITGVPKGLAEEITGESLEGGVSSQLGGEDTN